MTTVNELITSGLRLAGVIGKGETPSASEVNEALAALNARLESDSNEGLMIYARITESFPLISQQSYTIGTGGDFNTARPINIVQAYVRQDTIDYTLDILSDENYANITHKSLNGIPDAINYVQSYPLGTINIYPVADAAYTLFLVSEKPLSSLSLNTNVQLPPGWVQYLKNQLAIDVGPEYGVQPSQVIYENAKSAKEGIMRTTSKTKSLDVPAGPYGRGNIYSGWY